MRRKSERNKAKGSPEKKVEKPTRKSARRRGKRATSSSPERDDSQEDTTSDASLSRESNKDSTNLQTKELKPVTEKSDTITLITHDVVDKDSSPETEDNGSVWKVARADASPGEIQKLKLCRQRNISETSDNSSSRKRSHKWQGSGEGVLEEIDSNDERLSSPQIELSSNQPDDASSLPPGQDSNQEVSDYKETQPEPTSANLSDDKPNIDLQGDSNEATCSNLSNDIKSDPIDTSADNISSEGDAAAAVQAVTRLQEIMTEQIEGIHNQENQQGIKLNEDLTKKKDQDSGKKEKTPEKVEYTEQDDGIPLQEKECVKKQDLLVIEKQISPPPQEEKEEKRSEFEDQISKEEIPEIEGQISQEIILKDEKNSSKKNESPRREEILQKEESLDTQQEEKQIEKEDEEIPQGEEKENLKIEIDKSQKNDELPQRVTVISETNDSKNVSSEDEREKANSDSNSIDETKVRISSSVRVSSRSNRRKHCNKYRDSSNSDTPESEDEPSLERESKQPETPEEDEEEEEEEQVSSEKDYRKVESCSKPLEPTETSLLLNSGLIQVEEEDKNDKDSTSAEKSSTLLNTTSSSQKPAKINLKRTFSIRISTDEPRNEDSCLSASIDSNQIKENHANDNTEQKRIPKRRRWGTTLSTDSTIEFSVSTDSLKALVPGAKPLSITEVRLSKDDEDEQIDDKSRDKYITSDSNGEYIAREDTVAPKIEGGGSRKGDTKTDNHIGSRRKISVVKEIPQALSPSPTSVKATSILLIKNLVRPFTLTQIKELLSRTGTIVENGFWMDRIKSKCFVEYNNEDQAFETRQALHGISWPMSNPKKLQVEYASKEDMEFARESSKDEPNSRKTEPPLVQSNSWQRDWTREERNQVGGTKVMVVREWDLGKEDGQQHVVKEEREKKDFDKKKRQRSQSPSIEVHLPAPARKFKKKEDELPPAKLLDDLFRKTKATPCIYWLPLTNDQIVVKEEMRRQHMAEHARRLDEMRRAERNRDTRRRRSPRK